MLRLNEYRMIRHYRQKAPVLQTVDCQSRILSWLRGSGCDAAILGCTELSVYRTYHGLPDYYLDAMEILAERCITACGYKLRMV